MTTHHGSREDLSEILPFHRHLGVSHVEATGGRAVVRLDAGGEISNRKGDVHGGAVAALFDIVMSRAVRSANVDAWGLATVSMTINYLEPARGSLVARARLVRNGRTLAVTEATIEREDGRFVAQASAVFRIIAQSRAHDATSEIAGGSPA
jgi:uncharacterized protein (TIGR00369 family)